jgi:hypothetical protein
MPFDHAKCPNPQCAAVLDPERLKAGPRGPVCPRCDTPLSMEDIFGVAANWAEEDQPNLSLDDAVPGFGESGHAPSGGGGGGRSIFEDDDAPPARRPGNLLSGPTSSKKSR